MGKAARPDPRPPQDKRPVQDLEEEIKEAREAFEKAQNRLHRLQALQQRKFEQNTMQPKGFTREQ
jgi:hypothetical protein